MVSIQPRKKSVKFSRSSDFPPSPQKPSYAAARGGHLEALQALGELRADLGAPRSYDAATPAGLAARRGDAGMFAGGSFL